jgi:hypothetical protein
MQQLKTVFTVIGLGACLAASTSYGQFENVTIQTQAVAGNVSMLIGQGGNIGVSAGEDGILIIDDQYAPQNSFSTRTFMAITQAATLNLG